MSLNLPFAVMSDTAKQAIIAAAAVGREQELWQYQLNIDNYTHMLATLPQGDWTEDIAPYKGVPLAQVPAALQQAVSNYTYRDQLAATLVTETIEQNKSLLVYNALVSQLPQDTAHALIQAAANPQVVISSQGT